MTIPSTGKPFNSRYEERGGYWLDEVDMVSSDGQLQPPQSVLVWQGRIYRSDNPLAKAELQSQLPRYQCRDYLLLPGFINSHTHIAMSLFKGLASVSATTDLHKGDSSLSLVENLFFTLEQHLTADIIAGLCYPSILEALHSGTTTLVDSYFFSDQVAEAMTTLGMRGFVSEHFADLGGPHRKGLKDWPEAKAQLVATKNDTRSNLVGRIVYAHATDTVSAPLLTELAAFAKDQGFKFHMHLAQSFGETERTLSHSGLKPIPYAISCGAVSKDSVLVHLVDCSPADLELLRPYEPTIAICPVSEILYETLPNLPQLIESGLPILLGTDCPASNDGFDMAEELRAMALMYKLQSGKFLANGKALAQVWQNPSRHWYDEEPLADGSLADFSLVNKNLSLLPIHDMASHIVYSHISRHIEAVCIDGKLLSRHGRYVGEAAEGLAGEFGRSLEAIERILWDKFRLKSAGTQLAGFRV